MPPVQQVADEKTCMKFSIRRPKLPSSETHPEESTYHRLDVAAWLRHLNELGQVEEEYKLRKVRGGATVWGRDLRGRDLQGGGVATWLGAGSEGRDRQGGRGHMGGGGV